MQQSTNMKKCKSQKSSRLQGANQTRGAREKVVFKSAGTFCLRRVDWVRNVNVNLTARPGGLKRGKKGSFY